MWTQQDAIRLCRDVEMVCPEAGCHVALTGGLLYKAGARKDCDLLFYRIRQKKEIDMPKLFDLLVDVGIKIEKGSGFLYKATWNGQNLDLFFPEVQPKVKGIPGFSDASQIY